MLFSSFRPLNFGVTTKIKLFHNSAYQAQKGSLSKKGRGSIKNKNYKSVTPQKQGKELETLEEQSSKSVAPGKQTQKSVLSKKLSSNSVTPENQSQELATSKQPNLETLEKSKSVAPGKQTQESVISKKQSNEVIPKEKHLNSIKQSSKKPKKVTKSLKKLKKKSIPKVEEVERDDDVMQFELKITDSLREHVDGEPLEVQQEIAMAVLETKQHFLESKKKLSGIEHAKYVHSLIQQKLHDDTIKNNDNISCKKGCNWCCQQMVFITSNEAELLVERKKETLVTPETMKYLRAQSIYGEENVDLFWGLPTEKSACVFLKDGLCSVYEDRPSSCRTFQVSSNPRQCAKNGGLIDKVISVGSEIISSASLGVPDQKYGSLPRMILEEMEKRNLIKEEE